MTLSSYLPWKKRVTSPEKKVISPWKKNYLPLKKKVISPWKKKLSPLGKKSYLPLKKKVISPWKNYLPLKFFHLRLKKIWISTDVTAVNLRVIRKLYSVSVFLRQSRFLYFFCNFLFWGHTDVKVFCSRIHWLKYFFLVGF